MYSDSFDSTLSQGEIEVMLDGAPVGVPAGRQSLAAIRAYLEMLVMEQQRILCTFNVQTEPANVAQLLDSNGGFCRIEAESVDLEEMPVQIIKTALEQTAQARKRTESAITLVLINDCKVAHEFWWDLALALKLPLVTLSLLPENVRWTSDGCASLVQLHKWRLQQLACVIKEVDEACWSDDANALSNALENRVLPWLHDLHDNILLWQETALAGSRLKYQAA